MPVSRRSLLQLAMAPAALAAAQADDLAPTVSRVYPGTDASYFPTQYSRRPLLGGDRSEGGCCNHVT